MSGSVIYNVFFRSASNITLIAAANRRLAKAKMLVSTSTRFDQGCAYAKVYDETAGHRPKRRKKHAQFTASHASHLQAASLPDLASESDVSDWM